MQRIEIIEIDRIKDERGWLLKVLNKEHMCESAFGEIYVTAAYPGIIKAQHYHKNTTEWFSLINGVGLLVLQDIVTMERKEIIMGGDRLLTVKIPSGIAHAVKNIGNETMFLLAVADQPYNPKNPDTFSYEIDF